MIIGFWISLIMFFSFILIGTVLCIFAFALDSEVCGIIAFILFAAVGVLGLMATVLGIFALIAGIVL